MRREGGRRGASFDLVKEGVSKTENEEEEGEEVRGRGRGRREREKGRRENELKEPKREEGRGGKDLRVI